MRIAYKTLIATFAGFSLLCVACPILQASLGVSIGVIRFVFVLGTLGLVIGFVYAAVQWSGPGASRMRLAGSVVVSIIISGVAWILAVNLGRIAANLLGVPV